MRASQIVLRPPRRPGTGRRSFPQGSPEVDLPEMDGGIEQNPAYGTARTLARNFQNSFTVELDAILYTSARCWRYPVTGALERESKHWPIL